MEYFLRSTFKSDGRTISRAFPAVCWTDWSTRIFMVISTQAVTIFLFQYKEAKWTAIITAAKNLPANGSCIRTKCISDRQFRRPVLHSDPPTALYISGAARPDCHQHFGNNILTDQTYLNRHRGQWICWDTRGAILRSIVCFDLKGIIFALHSTLAVLMWSLPGSKVFAAGQARCTFPEMRKNALSRMKIKQRRCRHDLESRF